MSVPAAPPSIVSRFLADVHRETDGGGTPADFVQTVAPLMQRLLAGTSGFLDARHLEPHPQHYARHAIAIDPAGGVSLFAMVWSPGQWTPVHDHGTWGVVGVVDGVLEERSYMRVDAHAASDACGDSRHDSGLELRRGGVILLAPGTVTSFVPNPDHIHRTGVDEGRPTPTVSLHLYGHVMSNFNVYDVHTGTRKRVQVAYD